MKLLTIVFALFISAQVDAKQKIYKWTDSKGNVHYSAKKPQNQKANEVKIRSSKSTQTKKNEETDEDNKTATTDQELTEEQKSVIAFNKAEQERVQKTQDRENCKIAQKNKATLEKSSSIKKKNPATGEFIKMDKTEINNKLKEVNKAIRKLCR